MERIRKVSIWFKWIFMAGLVVYPLFVMVFWALADQADLPYMLGVTMGNCYLSDIPVLSPLTWVSRLLAFSACLLPMSATMVALYALVRLFSLYSRGEIFSRRNVQLIRWVGYALIARQIVDPFHQALLTLALTMNNPEGERLVSIGLSDSNITALLVGFVIVLISWVMDEGRKLKDEEALVI
ncbi:MAG: DUF2975 domain-containing protein [Desulfovibrionaceae bacterium]